MKKQWKTTAFAVALCLGVGALAGFLTKDGAERFQAEAVQPSFAPPGFLFPIVWTILYTLMGVSTARVFLTCVSAERKWGLNFFVVQLVLNFFWCLLFFNAAAYGAALVCLAGLWLAIVGMLLFYGRADRTAFWLQVPYLLWVSFAFALNYAVYRLNG